MGKKAPLQCLQSMSTVLKLAPLVQFIQNMEKHNIEVNIGMSDHDRKKNADGLNLLLADTYFLYLKTQNFHWNVTGSNFSSLHLLFESQYQELALAVDTIAESIRALGHPAHATFHEFSKITSIKESTGHPSSKEMILDLISANQNVIHTAKKVIHNTESSKDVVTIDLVTQRIQKHEKSTWMLRSTLE